MMSNQSPPRLNQSTRTVYRFRHKEVPANSNILVIPKFENEMTIQENPEWDKDLSKSVRVMRKLSNYFNFMDLTGEM